MTDKNCDVNIRFVCAADKDFWFSLDRHLSAEEFERKVRDKQGYVLSAGNKPAGILRYNLFWDNTPFCTLLYIDGNHRNKGYGRRLMEFWENDMKSKGYGEVLTSTRSDEDAQHFYRALGYCDCGSLLLESQPTELFFVKRI